MRKSYSNCIAWAKAAKGTARLRAQTVSIVRIVSKVSIISFEIGTDATGMDLNGIDIEKLDWIGMNFIGIHRISQSYRII
jgi:hypothetical protein